MKAQSILETIGNTPHVRIRNLFAPPAEVWMKLERANPGGSIKDRIALAMVEDAERRGLLKPGSTIIEPTSGNTGIGLSLVAAAKKYKIILVMPESMSVERRAIMAAYGASFDLTPREKGMKGAIERANELAAHEPTAQSAEISAQLKVTAFSILSVERDKKADPVRVLLKLQIQNTSSQPVSGWSGVLTGESKEGKPVLRTPLEGGPIAPNATSDFNFYYSDSEKEYPALAAHTADATRLATTLFAKSPLISTVSFIVPTRCVVSAAEL